MASVSPQDRPRQTIPRYVRVRVNGSQKRVSIGSRDRASANIVAGFIGELEQSLKLDTQPPVKVMKWVNSQPVEMQQRIHKAGLLPYSSAIVNKQSPASLVEWYVNSKDRNLKPGTIKGYQDRLNRFIEWCKREGITTVDKIKSSHLEKFKTDQIQRGKRSTARATMRRVSEMFRAAKISGEIQDNPAANVSVKTGHSRADLMPIGLDWFPKLLECVADVDLKTGLVLARYAGCRIPSEVSNLKWKHVRGLIGEEGKPYQPVLEVENVKTSDHLPKRRVVPIWPPLADYLSELLRERYGESSEHWFDHNQDDWLILKPVMRQNGKSYAGRLSDNGVWRRWKEFWQRSDDPAIPTHWLKPEMPVGSGFDYNWGDPIPRPFQACRRAFANNLLDMPEIPPAAAAAILGHSLQTLMGSYADILDRHLDWAKSQYANDPFTHKER